MRRITFFNKQFVAHVCHANGDINSREEALAAVYRTAHCSKFDRVLVETDDGRVFEFSKKELA